jgi:hypothetical protein
MAEVDRREKEFGGRMYSILIPPPSVGIPLCTDVAVSIGPVIGGLSAMMSKGDDQGAVLSVLLRGIDSAAIDRMMMTSVEASKLTVDGIPICTKVTFDKHFSTCRGDIFPVCLWVLTEVIADFFPTLAAFTRGASQVLKTG